MKHPAGQAGGAGPAPDVVRALFPSDRMDEVERYGELLATDGVVRGLIGPREVPRLWERHVVNCALLATALPRDAGIADIGSGAGLPGLVVALARPDLRVTLVEPLLRRTTFLEEAVAALGLDNVVVRRDRADALHGRETFDVVTARAVAPLERLLGWCMPLVTPHGALVAMKGDSAEDEIAAARPELERLGCAEPVIEVIAAPPSDPLPPVATDSEVVPHTRVVRVTWGDPARVSLPTSGRRGSSRASQSRSSRRKRSGS
ncbi:16S rRNA (guanine(527)-N(7))-methyltransferase RsmG [Nocardioides bizhenqiangii]|uniref:Ribosomal RNA small subunit methyltransferase G n=1 Tax=Nocardioides bizhenqiangii TaxID=3095076 RepID=A0ABZ0ZS73_9ACTN|nr:16S rRNA (guanine(527)-N(7))-methyltransferase RsmG [Nocardioides sp. HM61]WQQ26626.1 16S rRNA (guanine(527)-N(7))-methyltransferase RsmG [Nocardioides sp. HM61]